jgi:hypothetical protein
MMKKSFALIGFIAMMLSGCGQSISGDSSTSLSDSSATEIVEKFYQPHYSIPKEEELDTTKSANANDFDVRNVTKVDSPLDGMHFYWLGSSVTYGASSNSVSMVEYLSALTGATCKKDAISGTTLLCDMKSDNTGVKSYVNRLKTSKVFDENQYLDAFICQISTNDCTSDRLSKRGTMTAEDVFDIQQFDISTTLGAVEYIISYVTTTWACPVYFYSGSYFSDGTNSAQRQNGNPKGSDYGTFVSQVKTIADKWNKGTDYHVGVIDMFNDEAFNAAASDKYYSWACNDPIHPRKAGYLQWWTPYIQAYLENELA